MHGRTIPFLVIAAALSATAAAGLHPAAAASPAEGETLAEDQSFSYRLLDQFPTLDPQLNEETAGAHVIQQIFEGLMNQDAEGNLSPGVATGFEASEGNRVYTFALRDDARWSNGEPVTAQDFVYGWQRAVDPATASPYAWFVELAGIENASRIVAGEAEPADLGVEAVDDHTLRVALGEPTPFFPAMTATATLFPAPRATIEEFGSDWTAPGNIVSNGAYTLEKIALNEYFELAKNPEYWDADEVVIAKVTGLVINDANQALTRWESGEFDMLEPLLAGTYPRLRDQYPDEANQIPRLCSYFYAVNLRDTATPELQDVRVRRALSYAVDRDVLVDQVLKGGQIPAYYFTHEATAGFRPPEIPYAGMTQAERDAEARRLLEEAGVDGMDLKLIYNTDESHRQIATVISQMWKQKLGIETTLENMEWSTYIDVRKAGNFDLARSGWCGDYNEASTFLQTLTTGNQQNDGKYSNPEVDALMARSKTSDDPQPLYTEAEALIAGDMGIIPIYHYTSVFLLNASIRGFPLHNVENNWYVKDFYRVADE